MKLKKFNKLLSFIIFIFLCSNLTAEEQIDIWKKEKKESNVEKKLNTNPSIDKENFGKININKKDNSAKIENEILDTSESSKVFGIYDPEVNNFNLNMWSTTDADDVRASLKRLKKIKLSKTSNEILKNVLLSFSYPPQGMNEKEFVNLKQLG